MKITKSFDQSSNSIEIMLQCLLSANMSKHDIPSNEFNLSSYSPSIQHAEVSDGWLLTIKGLIHRANESVVRYFRQNHSLQSFPTIDIEITPQNDSTQSMVSKQHKNNRYHRLFKISLRIKAIQYQNDINWS